MAAKKRTNQIPGRVKQYWCYGCNSFVIIDWKEGKYHCTLLDKDIRPAEHFDCKSRNITDFVSEGQMNFDEV